MTHELDSTRAVRAWLEEGVTHLPERVLDSVMAELPAIPQRRRSGWSGVRSWQRSTWVRLLVALMTLALIGASLAVATGAWRPVVIPRPFDAVPLEAGRYVIDDPFPVRISLDVPAGWQGEELTSDTVLISRTVETVLAPSLTFTLVDAVYPDPCHFDTTSIDQIGPGVDDLAGALARLRGLDVTPPVPVSLGGYAARALTLTAPRTFDGCSRTDPRFVIWGLPQTHWLAEGEVNRIWVTQVGTTRLVVGTEVYSDTPPDVAAELAAMVDSIRIEQFAAVAVPTPPPPPTPLPSPEPTIAPLPAGWSLENIAYLTYLTVYDHDPTGQVVPVDVLDAVFEGQTGWGATGRGIASDQGAPPAASLSWWNVGTVYRDPCHWESGTVDPVLLRSHQGLSDALSRWTPGADAPVLASDPIATAWLGLVYRLQFDIPERVDVATCDAGQYRLWAEHDGTPRLGYPGEHIQLDLVDFEPGLLVVDSSSRRDASVVERGQAQAARDSLWIGRAHEPTPSP